MLRIVDLPHPDGPTIATNSLSATSNDTSWTASTPRAPSRNVFARCRTMMRGRRALRTCIWPGRGGRTTCPRRGVGDRLLHRERQPHLHPVLVVALVDHEVPVEDRLVVAHRLEDVLGLEGVHVGRSEEVDDLLILRPPDPLLGAIGGVHVRLHEVGCLLDR